MQHFKFGVILGNVGSCRDRYCDSYGPNYSVRELFDRVAEINDISGVELVGNWHITKDNANEIKEHLERTGLEPVSLIPDHFGSAKWKKGAFSNPDKSIRQDAIKTTKEMIDIAVKIGCQTVSLWPGQDGYDYSFSCDFLEERRWLTEGIKECCLYNPDITICLEYKPREPRQHSHIARAADTLLLVNSIGLDNLGVTLDVGHSLMAYENVSESISLCKFYGDKLRHMHFNDNYRYWDDDMIAGSVHTIEFLEMLYWLKKTDYSGWLSMDQYPYREDGVKAVSESVLWLKAMLEKLDNADESEIESVIKARDGAVASKLARELIFG